MWTKCSGQCLGAGCVDTSFDNSTDSRIAILPASFDNIRDFDCIRD